MQSFVYARWSSLEQGSGSTLSRQVENCRAYLTEKGWIESGEPIIDRGRSAYTGENIDSGNLGVFSTRFLKGAFGASVNLIVEELDRLSRQPPDVMLRWLSPLVRKGLTIHVTETRQVISEQMLDYDLGGLFTMLVTAFGSHSESKKKAARVSAAWDRKRHLAGQGEEVTRNHRSPAWLHVEDGKFVITPENRAIIERVFRRRIEGAGKELIAKELNSDQIKVWSNTSRSAKMWSATYVGRLLTNRAVLGEWQPYSKPRGSATRRPIGGPILDYYPVIISHSDFEVANDQREANQRKHIGRGRAISNLLGTKARCALCEGQMEAKGSSRTRINKKGHVSRHYFLYCRSAKLAKACDNQKGWTYDRIEKPLLDTILAYVIDDHHFSMTGSGEAERLVRERKETLAVARRRLERWGAIIDGDDNDAAIAAMKRWGAANRAVVEAEELLSLANAELDQLNGRVSPAEHFKRLGDVRMSLDAGDPEERFAARLLVKRAIGDLIEKISFNPNSDRVAVSFRENLRVIFIGYPDGEISDFDLVHARRPRQSDDPIVQAYLRRLEKRREQ